MKTKFILTMMLCLSIAGAGIAQTVSLSGFKYFSSSVVSPIMDGKEVKGYTMFYKMDKADKQNDNYGLSVYDENLKLAKTITLQKPRGKYLLIGNAYDGNVIAFYFYNFKEDQFELECYDKSLVKKGELTVEHKLSNMEKMAIQRMREADDKEENNVTYDLGISAIPGKGFVTNGVMKNGKGFSLDFYDDKMHARWHYETAEDSKECEAFMINQINEKFVLGVLIKRPGVMSKKATYYVAAFDADKGKKIMERPVESSDQEQLSLNTVTYEEASDQIFAIGDYYAEKDKPGVSKSKGFYIKSFSTDGKEINKKMYSWEMDVKSMLPPETKESMDRGAMNFTHKVLRGENGNFYLINEQFSRQADAGGIAMAMLSGGRSQGSMGMSKAIIWNMLVYVLKPDFTLSEIRCIAKDKSNNNLPGGAEFLGSGMIGAILKYYGDFDYQFTQRTNDGKSFDIVYINYDKEKGESTKRILGNIIIGGSDGKINVDKIDITERTTASFVYPAKPGYVMMTDYLKKEHTVGLKLVKLNY